MNAPISFVWSSQTPAATKLAYAVASWDECVSLVGEDAGTAAVLDQAEHELSRQGIRCIRVCGLFPDGVALQGFMEQVAGRAASGPLSDEDLEASFVALTEPGHGYNRVALLVERAHGLRPSAVRYIQFACQSSPKLLVVLAGQPSLAAALAGDEFAYLRHRITRKLKLPGPAANDLLQLLSTAPDPSPREPPQPVTAARRSNGLGTLVKLGFAASLSLAVWTTRWGGTPAPSMTAGQPDASPGRAVAVAHVEPEAPTGGMSSAGLEAYKVVAAQTGLYPAEAGPPPVADMPASAEYAAPEQEPTQAVQPPIEAFPEDAPAPPASLAGLAGDDRTTFGELPAAAVPEQPEDPAEPTVHATAHAPEQAASPPAPDTPAGPPAPALQDQPEGSAQPTEHAAAYPRGQAVAAGMPSEETAPRSEQGAAASAALGAEPAAAQAPGPLAAQAPQLPLPPRPLAAAPPFRMQAAAAMPPGASEKARRTRGTAELNAAPVEVPPIRSMDEARCRDIVFKAQLGEDPSDADKRFMRGGCRAK